MNAEPASSCDCPEATHPRLHPLPALTPHDRPADLTGPQFTVLGTLYVHGSMDQGTLGQHAGLDKSTAAPIVERLRGRLVIGRHTTDARRRLLELTPEGRQMLIHTAPFAEVDEQVIR
ncbi:MAG: DNA-binding protein [Streptosporangiaceae bacterium]|nr:DNA-binding protein [Streptosporangiaceae bacterium]